MRKIHKENKEVDVITKFCDKCDAEIKTEPLGAFDCNIDLRVGEFLPYGEGFWGEDYEVDLCETCAKELFLTTFPKLGIKINT
jgi:hypothetical protein